MSSNISSATKNHMADEHSYGYMPTILPTLVRVATRPSPALFIHATVKRL